MDLSGGDAAAMSPPQTTEPTGADIAPRKAAPYIFHDQTTSLCETCLVFPVSTYETDMRH